MQSLYFIVAAIHFVALVVTGIMWVLIDVNPRSTLRPQMREVRAVHFGCLYLIPTLLGLAYAFDRLAVPAWHQVIFPAGLGLLLLFSSVAYVLPRPPDLDPFYYWTRGWPLLLSLIGLAFLVLCLLWTAAILVIHSLHPPTFTPSTP